MIKFTASKGGGILIGFGLSEENIKKLKEGFPILVHLKELNLPSDDQILIFYGKTEAKIREGLDDFIGPGTKITEDTHGKQKH